ncbi:hypothetical protein SUGI_0187350 [Cryptomeria japonica]|nr:hypothetical protein SUGI_0187350 [Cryptomeria japonica]
MKNLILLAIVFAILVHPSHQLSRHEVLSKFVERRRSRVRSEAKEWEAPSISSKYEWNLNQYAQDGLQENDKISSLPGQPVGITFAQYGGYVTVDAEAGRALLY